MKRLVAALSIRQNKILVGEYTKKKEEYEGMITLPGGHVEKEETFKNALIRELREELGNRIEINIIKPVVILHFRNATTLLYHTEIHGNIIENGEITKVRYESIDFLKTLPRERIRPIVREFVKDILSEKFIRTIIKENIIVEKSYPYSV